jgi:hypothetical protein
MTYGDTDHLFDRTPIEQDVERYAAACHAMQSAVAEKMELYGDGNSSETTPKHLRVGVNSAMVETGVIAKVLIDKGIITEAEYRKAMADAMEREVESYRQWFSDKGYPMMVA